MRIGVQINWELQMLWEECIDWNIEIKLTTKMIILIQIIHRLIAMTFVRISSNNHYWLLNIKYH